MAIEHQSSLLAGSGIRNPGIGWSQAYLDAGMGASCLGGPQNWCFPFGFPLKPQNWYPQKKTHPYSMDQVYTSLIASQDLQVCHSLSADLGSIDCFAPVIETLMWLTQKPFSNSQQSWPGTFAMFVCVCFCLPFFAHGPLIPSKQPSPIWSLSWNWPGQVQRFLGPNHPKTVLFFFPWWLVLFEGTFF